MPIDFNFILLLIVVGVSLWLMMRANRPLKEEALKLSVDQARSFHQKYRKKANRADMPDELRAVAEASDRARPVTLAACATIAASVAAYIFIGA
ncbi:hypothetical protein [Hasllibacter sp. MH4015]|uniref:hypothetical protein n=1 Tax=Hasllibacter sp. MH4015 TaxID=2854029 RepID=UPI001CD786B3|nr:hypothetical protein [Hasllibacter sp. MH4015]